MVLVPPTSPPAIDHADIMAKIPLVAANNSAGAVGNATGYEIQFDPPTPVFVTLPKSTAYYDQLFGAHQFQQKGIIVMSDVVAQAALQGVDLQDRDLVAVYSDPELANGKNTAVEVGRFAWLTGNGGNALGVFHEWDHAFGAAHAEVSPASQSSGCSNHPPCYPVTCMADGSAACGTKPALLDNQGVVSSLQTYQLCMPPTGPQNRFKVMPGGCLYGDSYDYMGLQAFAFRNSQLLPRVDPQFSALFPAEEETHTHPLRKLQQGWLDRANVLTVDGAVTDLLVELDAYEGAGPGIRAVEIPRRTAIWRTLPSQVFGERDISIAESIWIIWRMNEPLLNGNDPGVVVSTGSERMTGWATVAYELDDDLSSQLDHEDLALNGNERLKDTFRGITIDSLGVQPQGFSGSRVVPTFGLKISTAAVSPDWDHIPQIGITITPSNAVAAAKPNPLLAGDVGETVNIRVEAVDPGLGSCVAGAGIDRLEVEIFVGPEIGKEVLALNSMTAPAAGGAWFLDWNLLIERTKLTTSNGDDVRSKCLIEVVAITKPVGAGGPVYRNAARSFFMLDQTLSNVPLPP